MFQKVKDFFKGKFVSEYEMKSQRVLEKFKHSENPYDVKVAEILENMDKFDFDEYYEWANSHPEDKKSLVESMERFLVEVK